jgi:hypothetical protein
MAENCEKLAENGMQSQVAKRAVQTRMRRSADEVGDSYFPAAAAGWWTGTRESNCPLSGALGGDDLAGEGEALAAARLGAAGAIGAGRARRAGARRRPHVAFPNRVTDANDHVEGNKR